MKLYIVRNKDGILNLFRGKPVRDNDKWIRNPNSKVSYDNIIELSSKKFPQINWETEPIHVELRISSNQKKLLNEKV